METNGKKLYTTHEVAKLLGVTPITVIRWIDSGRFKCYTTVGGHRRVDHEELVRFTQAHNLPWLGNHKNQEHHDFLILVIDHEQDIDEHFEDMVQFLPDVRYRKVADGYAAAASLSEEKPDLLILNLVMPGFDPFSFVQFLKKDHRFHSIPVISILTLQHSMDPVKLKESGLLDVMIRPFATPYLVKRIEAYRHFKQQSKAA